MPACPPRRVSNLLLLLNVERLTPSAECRIEVQGTKYEVGIDTRCKKQEIRLSSVDMKIQPTEQDFHLDSCI